MCVRSQEQDKFPHDQFEHAIGKEYCLVQALLDWYNDDHSLFWVCALSLSIYLSTYISLSMMPHIFLF